jgi:ankyrin repeat protein
MLEEKEAALVLAAENGQTDTVRALLDAGANVHVVDDMPLRLAALNGHADTVKALLDAGADVHADEDAALLLAAGDGHAGTVKALLDAGADVHAKEDWVLRWAAENGHADTVRLLSSSRRAGRKSLLRARKRRKRYLDKGERQIAPPAAGGIEGSGDAGADERAAGIAARADRREE